MKPANLWLCVLLGCSAGPAKVPEPLTEGVSGGQTSLFSILKAESQPLPEPTSAVAMPSEPSLLDLEAPPPEPAPLEPLPAGTTVLHVGSSSAGAMGPALNKELEAHGVKGVVQYKQSTTIPQWAGEAMGFKRYIAEYDPDLVLVSLGGNETSLPDPTKRIESIQRLVKLIGDRPCVWVGTPRWKKLKHTGLLEVIRDAALPCKFIDTDELAPDMKPAKDGVHPTMAERRRWARRVLQWLQVNRDPQGEHPWAFKEATVIPEDTEAETPLEPSDGLASPSATAPVAP